jgi:ABC-type transport system involved in cytochrome c biogenesis permease subunit
MSSTSIQTAPPPPAPRPRPQPRAGLPARALAALASLRLTVALFVLSLFLVFVGTLAQMDNGVGTVVSQYFRSLYVWVPLQLFVRFGQVFLFVPYGTHVGGAFPFPGGWLIGGALLVNLLAAHAVRFRLTWKRSGVLVLHAGLVVMMVGELVTGLFASEGLLTIKAGGASNYVEHRDAPELAVVGPLPGHPDEVTVVPAARLRRGGLVRSDALHFDVQVDEYMVNSALEKAAPGAPNRATAGAGLQFVASSRKEGAGVDSEQRIDLASAYVTFKKKGTGESVGTYLLSVWLTEMGEAPQAVTADGQSYEVALRFKRTYKPYTVQLREFRHDRYPGTDIPKNFSSDVRLVDPARGEDRTARISMNAPLQYTGQVPLLGYFTQNDTFYQQGFLPGDSGTILQVVTNPGWVMPYLSCGLVVAGMLIHFGIKLVGFLRKQRGVAADLPPYLFWMLGAFAAGAVADVLLMALTGRFLVPALGMVFLYGLLLVTLYLVRGPSPEAPAGTAGRIFPWAVLAAAAVGVLGYAAPPAEDPGQPRLEEAARLPAQESGRIKPLDTVARTTLMQISDKQTFTDTKGRTRPAVQWLLDVMTSRFPGEGHAPDSDELFRVEDEQVVRLLGLEPRSEPLYKYGELAARLPRARAEAGAAAPGEGEKPRTAAQAKLQDLAEAMASPPAMRYEVFRIENDEVLGLLGLPRRSGLRYAITEFAGRLGKLEEEATKAEGVEEKDRTAYQVKVLELARKVQAYIAVARLRVPHMIPPAEGTTWKTLPEAVQAGDTGPEAKAAYALMGLLQAHATGRADAFNRHLEQYQAEVDQRMPGEADLAGFETFFNRFAPFYVCAYLYVGAFLLAAFSWVGWSRPLNRAAFLLALLALGVHGFGLIARMVIQGRPPVTNLYSSAVFIGLVGVLLGLVLEVVFRVGIGNALAGALGFMGVVIAHQLSAGGDTLEMMRAVLDTNFWLATHVVCVTIGYAATFLAGLLGAVYIVAGVFTRYDDGRLADVVAGALLAAVCLVAGGLAFLLWSVPVMILAVVGLLLGVVALAACRGRVYKALSLMIYGVVCFATLFSFVGTVLGGIWADYSWGRFWGWDPKENGALLIVVMNALVLHARWGGLVKDRGMAVLTVCGNLVTAWSWFGTNQLGIGLHSYGFNNGLAMTLTGFWLSQLLVICLGMVPMRWWRGGPDIQASAAAATRGRFLGGPASA